MLSRAAELSSESCERSSSSSIGLKCIFKKFQYKFLFILSTELLSESCERSSSSFIGLKYIVKKVIIFLFF